MQISGKYTFMLIAIFCFMQVLMLNASSNSTSDSVYCLNAVRYFEKKYKIPKNFLYLISLVESGKWDENSKRLQPWPWAANISGKSKFFKNKREMVMFLKKYIANGQESIDVGCTQINYKYHKQHFDNIEQMITPYYNVGYSAYYLSQNFSKTGNWNEAIALHHSKNPNHNGRYIKKIRETAKVTGNLQMALNNTKKNPFSTYISNEKNHKKITLKKNSSANIIVYDINNTNVISSDVIRIHKKLG